MKIPILKGLARNACHRAVAEAWPTLMEGIQARDKSRGKTLPHLDSNEPGDLRGAIRVGWWPYLAPRTSLVAIGKGAAVPFQIPTILASAFTSW